MKKQEKKEQTMREKQKEKERSLQQKSKKRGSKGSILESEDEELDTFSESSPAEDDMEMEHGRKGSRHTAKSRKEPKKDLRESSSSQKDKKAKKGKKDPFREDERERERERLLQKKKKTSFLGMVGGHAVEDMGTKLNKLLEV